VAGAVAKVSARREVFLITTSTIALNTELSLIIVVAVNAIAKFCVTSTPARENTLMSPGSDTGTCSINGITKPAIRRIARRGGVKRISGMIYEETRQNLKQHLETVIRDSVTYTEYSKRRTVTALDVCST